MTKKEEYLEWHKENKEYLTHARIVDEKERQVLCKLHKALQFADAAFEQCDKLEKKVNDQARVIRDQENVIRDLSNACDEQRIKLADKEKELSELKEKYRWRDVDEELPKVNQRCIVQFKDKDGVLYEECGLDYFPEIDSDLIFYDPYTNGYISDKAVLWMPIPEFKQKGSGDEVSI